MPIDAYLKHDPHPTYVARAVSVVARQFVTHRLGAAVHRCSPDGISFRDPPSGSCVLGDHPLHQKVADVMLELRRSAR